jgi:ribonuclease HI
VEWALELSSIGLRFESTSSIHSRALAEFIVEWMPNPDEDVLETVIPGKEAPQEWIMYFDGVFSLQGAGAGVLLVAPTGEHLKYIVQMHFPWEEATNNTAGYEGLLAELRIAIELGIKKLIIRGDSQLVVRQINKDYQSPLMEAYVEEVRKLEENFDGLQTEHVPRAENSIADHLSKCAAQKLPVEQGTFVLHLTQPSVSPTTMASKRRKLNSGKHLPAELPKAPGRRLGGNNSPSISDLHPPTELPVFAVEACAPIDEEVLLVLVAKPQTPTWARHIVHFLLGRFFMGCR